MNRIFTVILICSCIFAANGCKDASDGKKNAEMGPEEIVAAFTRAVAGGDFAGALALCDTSAMNEYIREQETAWHMLEAGDSSAYSIATKMLAEADVEIIGTVKDGERRHLSYTVSFDGMTKEKEMTVQKEEGGWKITAISDRK